jgi:hypothetical protein
MFLCFSHLCFFYTIIIRSPTCVNIHYKTRKHAHLLLDTKVTTGEQATDTASGWAVMSDFLSAIRNISAEIRPDEAAERIITETCRLLQVGLYTIMLLVSYCCYTVVTLLLYCCDNMRPPRESSRRRAGCSKYSGASACAIVIAGLVLLLMLLVLVLRLLVLLMT